MKLRKETIKAFLDTRRDEVLGRALVALKDRQTPDEQQSRHTKHDNDIGFRVCDAYMGTAHAKHWESKKWFSPKQSNYWWRPHGVRQQPRIYAYIGQLYKIAKEKEAAKLAATQR